jgi:hypothetical protein
MTQTGQDAGRESNTGLTAPGLVKITAFKAGEGTIFINKNPFSFSQDVQDHF